MYEVLYTNDLILRKANQSDLNKIFENVWSDEELTKNMLWEVTRDIESTRARLERTIKYQSENYAYLICLKNNN